MEGNKNKNKEKKTHTHTKKSQKWLTFKSQRHVAQKWMHCSTSQMIAISIYFETGQEPNMNG